MRIHRGWIPSIAKEIVNSLNKKKLVELNDTEEKVIEVTSELILDELMVEDRLNKEVRELLKKYDIEIEKGHLDYRRLFELTKQKLVKERNIIL